MRSQFHSVAHLVRQSLAYASRKERKPLASALQTIFGRRTEPVAVEPLEAVAAGA